MTKNLIYFFSALFLFSSCNQVPQMTDIRLRDGIYYKSGELTPYSGSVQAKYATGEDSILVNIQKGLFDGPFTSFYKNGNMKDSVYYKNGVINNMFCWNENGVNTKVSESQLIKNKDGFWKMNDNSVGELFTGIAVDSNNIVKDKKYILLSSYKSGELHGPMIKFYTNGNICFSKSYKNGVKNGYFIWYYENGTTECEGMILNGKKDGRWVWYKKNGAIDEEDVYKNGSYKTKCDCCNKEYWSEEGWSSVPRYMSTKVYSPSQDGGPYCSEGCAIECR